MTRKERNQHLIAQAMGLPYTSPSLSQRFNASALAGAGDVPVYSRDGKIIATVRQQCTSIGAAKAAKAERCEWTLRFKQPGWVVK